MVNEFEDETENDDDLVSLADKGLPLKMGKVYEKVIRKIIDNDKKPKDPPLWKANHCARVVLSLLTFAKRPLTMTEVVEAIAMLRTPSGCNLREDRATEKKILNCCLSLVRHTPKESDGYNVGLLRLSHSAVRTFLLDSSTTISFEAKHQPLVESRIIGDCCLRYLSQPRYGILLVKRDTTKFETIDHVTILPHQFLLYAAKYWFQHFDSQVENSDTCLDDRDKTIVTGFLRSTNFRTAIQIQSLFVTGHFLQNFDSITDRGLNVRRTLPDWVRQYEPGLHRQYQTFQGEWCRLLQAGPSESFRGEIDRCFWGALGSDNFLSSHNNTIQRYDSFEFRKRKGSRMEGDSCQVHSISQDGRRLVTAWVQTRENQKYICVEIWTLDGKSHPQAMLTTTMPFSATDTCIALYALPCSQSFHSIPLIPRIESVVPPDAISLRLNGSIIRLGSKIFYKGSTDGLSHETVFRELTGKSLGDSWEEVCIRDPFMVVCRRRVYRKRPNSDDPSSDDIASQPSEGSDSDDIRDDLDVQSQGSEDDDSDIKSALSVRSGNSNATGSSGSVDSVTASQIIGSASSTSGDGEIESDVSQDEILSAEPAAANPAPEGPVVISTSKGRIHCDSCDKTRLRTWYHCVICNNNNFDLCDRCERKGTWCLNVGHQLYKIVNRKPSGVVSRRNFNVRQELAVYRTGVLDGDDKPAAFNFRKKYRVMLYDSPPVIHQTYSLVVWALSDSSLLFVDPTHNQFFEQKITAAQVLTIPRLHIGRPICVNLSFSPCGKLLRIAIVEVTAEKTKPTKGTTTNPASAPKSRLCLNLHILVLQLSSSQPARNRPKLLTSKSCRLGCSCARAFVPTLPFGFTWGASDLYFTLSDWYLHVYRVKLPEAEAQKPERDGVEPEKKETPKITILVPKEKILLPRSSRNRSVQFFPSMTRDTKNIVIIGPRYGHNPTPPIGVYLSEKDLGGWADITEMGDTEDNLISSQKTLGDNFEEPWDENKDCILIPFDGY
ncbi:hypothetical protein F5Y09DRAFT_354051 [Xylaria sp. FL1042]|nr:hypothetical protein F5Y09DRAFT_354051 [Xylaria sp. FL1042]